MGFNCPSLSPTDFSTGYLGVLGDLNHSNPFVRQTLLKWVHEMVQNYSLDALRLDTAVYLDRGFLPEVQDQTGVQVLGEATVNNLTFQASLMHGGGQSGLLGLLNFPPFYQLPRAFCGYRIGAYSSWLTKVKGEGAKARWLSSTTKRYFTIDFNSQLFFYAQSESQKTLFTHSYQAGNSLFLGNEQLVNKLKDAELWVSALNAARDIANGKVPVQAPSSTKHSHELARPPGSSLSTSTSEHNGDHRGEDGRAPWEPPPVTKRWTQPAPVQQAVAAPPPPPVDPFAALDALEELAGPAPEDTGAAVAPELQAEKGRFDDFALHLRQAWEASPHPFALTTKLALLLLLLLLLRRLLLLLHLSRWKQLQHQHRLTALRWKRAGMKNHKLLKLLRFLQRHQYLRHSITNLVILRLGRVFRQVLPYT
eukprot:g24091.t1